MQRTTQEEKRMIAENIEAGIDMDGFYEMSLNWDDLSCRIKKVKSNNKRLNRNINYYLSQHLEEEPMIYESVLECKDAYYSKNQYALVRHALEMISHRIDEIYLLLDRIDDDKNFVQLFNRTTELINFKKGIVEMYIDDKQNYLFYN